jgi:hypothetical protein
MYRGLKFGLDLSPNANPAVCVEGAVTRFEPLSRDHHGPRAIMNAVTRLVDGYEDEQRRAAKDLEISRGQLRDYQSRIGGVFLHGAYLEELHSLRDQLERALSDKPGEADQEEIVDRIKALREAHTVEAAPERTKRQAASIEEAVITRIMRGRENPSNSTPLETMPEQIEIPVQTAEIMRFRRPGASKPKGTHREKVEGEKRQLSLF